MTAKKLISDSVVMTGSSYRPQIGELLEGVAGAVESRTSKDGKDDYKYLVVKGDLASVNLFVNRGVLTELDHYKVGVGDVVQLLCTNYNTRGFADWRIVANLSD